MEKIWHRVEIATESEQNISVYPDEQYNGIIIEVKELDGEPSNRVYLDEAEMELLIKQMKYMIEYNKSGSSLAKELKR